MSSIQQDNLDHPLIHWVKAIYTDGRKIEYSDLFDGVLLNNLMNIVDSSPDENLVCKDACDFNTRLFNWDLLLKSIQAYYKDVLQVYLCVVCPDIYLISREPETDSSFKEVCKVLLLILGCAVQGEHREDFIFNIKQLDVTIQHAIVSYIQEITDESMSILPREKIYSDDEYIDKIINHVERLLKERDSLQYAHMVFNHENKTQQVHDQSDVSEKSAKPETESADKKIKVRVLQTQLDEKDEQISDLRDENEEVRRSLLSLKTEHLDLVQKFHSLRSLQDDLDAFKEKASKADCFEEEVAVLKKKLNEVEFYKARIQELQDDNSVLEETKTFLEDQVGSTHVRLETVSKLEIELKKNKLLLDEYSLKINLDSEKISALTQENVELQREMSLLVEKKLAHEANLSIDGFDNPISAELQESANVSKLQLELEIQRLNQQLNITEEEFENLRLQIKNYEESEQEQIKLGYRLKKLEAENVTLNEKLKEREKSRESLQHQSNVVESEKKMLREELVKIKRNQVEVVASLEVENQNLKKNLQKVDAELSEVQVKAVDCENILKENDSLQSQLQNVSISVKDKQDKLEEQEDEFSVEIQKLQQQLISGEGELLEVKFKSDNLQIENTNLQDKVKHCEQTLQSMQNKSEVSKDIRSEIIILQQELTQKENDVQELNSELKQLQSGNERLQEKLELSEHNVKSLRGTSEDLKELQSEIIDLDDELENKDREVQELKTKMKDLAEVQTDKEMIQTQLKTTEKKVISLRSKTEEMHSMIVDLQQKVSNKDVEVMDLCAKVKTLESETGKQQKEISLNKERHRLSSRAKSVDSVEMQSEILTLQQELQSKEQDVLELRSKVTELEKLQPEVEWLEQVVMTTEEELEKLKLKTDTDTEKMEFDNRRLQQELDVTKEDLGILHDKSTCNDSSDQLLTESVNNLESENKELSNQLKMAAAELQALKMEASKYSEGEKMVNESLNQVEFENEKLIEQLNMAEDELDMIKEKLSESEIVKRSLYEENRNFNESQCDSLNLLEVENQSLTERLDTAERELDIFRGKDVEIEILQQANVQLESQLTRSEKKPKVEHTQELQQYVAREERFHVVFSENQTLNKKLIDLEEDCQQLRHSLRQSEKERQSWEENNENVTDSQTRRLIKLHNENQDVINQLQLADKEIKRLKNENQCSETIKFAQSEQLNEAQVENQKLQEQVQEAEFEVKSLQQQLIAFEREIGIHKEEKMSFDSDVTESLNQLQNENETLIKQLQLAVDELVNMKKKLEVADEYKILYDESVKINEEKADVMNELSIRNDELANHLQQAQDDIQSMHQKPMYADKRQHSETQKSSPRQDIMENGHQHIPQSYIRKQNTIIARLQIQNTAIQCQFASLINQNSTLQNQMALLESEHENVLINHEELQIAHEHVLCDHEKLQKIHELLSLEYEDLVSEYVLTRTRLNIMHRDIIKPNCPVEKEIDGLSSSSSNELRGYNYKYNRQDIGEHPEDTYDSLEDPFEDFSAIDQDMQQMELNFNILHQINNTLEEENQALLLQLQQLLNQNQELLTSAIDNKDYFNEEEKSYIEKLAELRRKKERLEEKLMAHYGNPKDSPKKNRGFSALLKRVRAMILKSQKHKNKSSLETQNSVSQLNVNNNNSGSKQDSDNVPNYHSNFETDIDPEKLTLVEFLTERMDKLN